MTRGILIAGNESAFSRAIEAETLKRAERFTVALIPNRFTGSTKNTAAANEKRIALDWNPSSPISARTLVLAAENRMEQVTEAILVCSPPSIRSSAAELPLADIEIMINDHIKGWFFLARELAVIFSGRQSGTLALVYPEISISGSKDDATDFLGPSSLASFRALTHCLLASAHREHYITMGFSCSDTGNEAAFAAFIFKYIDETSKRSNGKLHKFGKFSLFK